MPVGSGCSAVSLARDDYKRYAVKQTKEIVMKKLLLSAALVASSVLASSASYAGCGEWGTVSYVYRASTGVLTIINGTACWVGVTGTSGTAVAAVLATAHANNTPAYVTSTGEVSIQ